MDPNDDVRGVAGELLVADNSAGRALVAAGGADELISVEDQQIRRICVLAVEACAPLSAGIAAAPAVTVTATAPIARAYLPIIAPFGWPCDE